MGAHQLVNIFGVYKVANLAARIDPVHRLASKSVPKSDASISGSSAAAHGAMLVGRPRDGLDCGNVLAELHDWFY